MANKIIKWDKQKLEALKKAHTEAMDNGQDVFTFEENEYVTSFAYYLIEYLTEQFN